MICIRICDRCKRAIKDFKELRQISLISRESWDCVVNAIWEFDLCIGCAQEIERSIRR